MSQDSYIPDNPNERIRLVQGGLSFAQVTETVASIAERPTTRRWLFAFLMAAATAGLVPASLAVLFWNGTGVWGLNNPQAWAWDIVNFVFWVGIAHAGTFISSILTLTRQPWRTSIGRFAEAMTVFSVACAGMFPACHVGRVWCAHWLFPVPNQMGLWPNFHSPLLWDVFAVNTYATVSVLFWYLGLIPDLATMRDRAKSTVAKIAYGTLCVGWTGSVRQWMNFEKAYQIFAAIATPLICAVSAVVSCDFAGSQIPGWHATIFPLYFVCGAVFQGFSATIFLMAICRSTLGLKNLITMRHLENLCKITLALSFIVTYIYFMEYFIAKFSGNPYEAFCFDNRMVGWYAVGYWTMIICNGVIPQLFWFRAVRNSIPAMIAIGFLGVFGMWFERYIIIMAASHDFLPSSWAGFMPTFWDCSLFLGSIGTFFTLLLIFIRFVPVISIAEVKMVMPEAKPQHGDHH